MKPFSKRRRLSLSGKFFEGIAAIPSLLCNDFNNSKDFASFSAGVATSLSFMIVYSELHSVC
jgi:hypothetical protein